MSLLGPLVTIKTGKLDANAAVEGGQYPFFTCSKSISHIDDYAFDDDAVLVAGNGDLNVKHYSGKFNAYQRTYVLTANDPNVLNTRYLYHFMDKYVEVLRQQSIGGVIKYIKLGNLTDAIIPLPSLPDQKRIAAILDKADAVCKKRKQALGLLDDFLRATFLDMFGDPVTNPKGWNMKPLKWFGDIQRGKSRHRPRNDPRLLGGEHPLIQTGNIAAADIVIEDYNQTYSDMGLEQSRKWPRGTLCITIAANIADTAILGFDACFPDSVVGFTTGKPEHSYYVRGWLGFLKKIIEEKAPQSAQRNINIAILSDLELPLPSQDLLIRYMKITQRLVQAKAEVEAATELTEATFSSLSQRAFRGEL